MKPDIFAEWLKRQGYHVVRTESSYWFNTEAHVFQAFPYHWVIQPTEQELRGLIRAEKVLALRYSTPVEAPEGCISYHAVLEDQNYSLETLDRRVRQNVRTGLKNCSVEQISLERLARDGWLLEKDTEERQGRTSKYTAEKWHHYCMAAADLPGFEAWGAIVNDQLVASLLTFQMDDWCEMITQQCHSDHLKNRVNNALAYTVTHMMLKRPGIRSVFYTIQSLDAPSSIDEFKFRMGYLAKPVRQRVVLHPLLEPFANPLVHAAAMNLARIDNKASYLLTKGAGMLRFRMNGKKPLSEQVWPEILLEQQKEPVLKGSVESEERSGSQES